ncbi:MAG: beta-lactamase family protein [Rhodanobacteraceae bacterium]|jgi:CubicO group peptidase (beta-lactamase class C family)|nr:beta-lactamase family protein [Rhodanobacteraceae bacterium]
MRHHSVSIPARFLPRHAGRLHRFLLAALATAALQAYAAPSASTVDEGARAQALLDALNAGSDSARVAWVDTYVSSGKREEVAGRLAVIAREAGGLTLTRKRLDGPIDKLYVRAKAGGSSRIDILEDEVDASRIGAVFSFPWPEPYPLKMDEALAKAGGSLARAIDARVRFSAERGDFAGTVLVRQGDRTVYSHSFGLADRDLGVPNAAQTRFNIGSMDKMFTAVAIGQLIEAGKLTLDTHLIDVLPDYPNAEAARAITIRHLLAHSAGLGNLFDRPKWERTRDYATVAALLPVFAAEPLEFTPGSKGSYSNEGFIVLGAVVERLSGQSWYDYVAGHVFAPMGMRSTGSPGLDEVAEGRAVGYRFREGDPLGTHGRGPNWTFLPYRGSSAGGGYSTAPDLLAFLAGLREGKLVSPAMAQTLTALNTGGEEEYGLGFMHVAKGKRTLRGHNGGGPGSGINAEAMIVWETGDAYAVVGNLDAPFTQILGSDIAELLVAAGSRQADTGR